MPQHQPASTAGYNSSQQQHLKQHLRKAVSKHHQPGGGISANNPGTPSSVTKQSANSPIQAVNATGGGGSGGGTTATAGNIIANKQNKTGQ